MRIISGLYKGKRLMAPKQLPVRPTTDFAKEGLFNILNHKLYFQEITMLDLFAGTGNIGYEFASRGCESVTSVDAHHGCVSYIQKIAEELSFPITAIKSDVLKYIQHATTSFDLIFADPPYDFEHQTLADLVAKIFAKSLLKPEGILIIEHTKHLDLSNVPNFQESRKYGGSVFSFFT